MGKKIILFSDTSSKCANFFPKYASPKNLLTSIKTEFGRLLKNGTNVLSIIVIDKKFQPRFESTGYERKVHFHNSIISTKSRFSYGIGFRHDDKFVHNYPNS